MIEAKNNDTTGPEFLAISIMAERDQGMFLSINVEDTFTGNVIADMYIDDLENAEWLLEELTKAVREFKAG